MEKGQIPTLTTVYIYMTEECNLHCSHCWIAAKREKTTRYKYPSLEEYINFINQALPLGLKRIKISGGEPLLRDDIYSLIELVSSKDVKVGIETNGTLITEEKAQFFEKMKVSLGISLDGSSPRTHDKQRGLNGAFEKTMAGLEVLQRYKVPIQIVTAISRANVNELPDILDIASKISKRNQPQVKINPIIASGRAKKLTEQQKLLNTKDLIQLVQKVENEYSVKYNFPIVVQLDPAFHSLKYMLRGLVGGGRCAFINLLCILANGDISFCAMGYTKPEFIMGNVQNIDLTKLWEQGDLLIEIRNKIPNQLEGVCKICIMKYTCQGGCRAYAVDTYGSIIAPSPSCQSLFEEGYFPKSRLLSAEFKSALEFKRKN